MKAEELKVGIYVLYGTPGNDLKNNILKLTQDMIVSLLSDDGLLDLDKVNPVILNEEWITHFSFIESVKGRRFYHPNTVYFELFKLNEDIGYYKAVRFDKNTVFILSDNLMYVHQLQNYYSASTGEELILKNKN